MGWLTYWWLFILTLLVGIIWAFNTAARLSLVPNLVEHNEVPSAVALDSVMFNVARFLGPTSWFSFCHTRTWRVFSD